MATDGTRTTLRPRAALRTTTTGPRAGTGGTCAAEVAKTTATSGPSAAAASSGATRHQAEHEGQCKLLSNFHGAASSNYRAVRKRRKTTVRLWRYRLNCSFGLGLAVPRRGGGQAGQTQ